MVFSTSGPIIVVLGATGTQGSSVVDHLLASDKPYHIKAVTRDPSSQGGKDLAAQGVEVVRGELSEKETLDELFKGATYVFFVTNTATYGPVKEYEYGQNVVNAAKKAGIKMLYWSGLENTKKASGGKFEMMGFDVKDDIFQYALEQGVPTVNVEAAGFMETFFQWCPAEKLDDGSIRITSGMKPEVKFPMIHTRKDYGAWVVGAIEKDVPAGTSVHTATGWYTAPEMCEALEKHFGKPVKYNPIEPLEGYKAFLPLPYAQMMGNMTAYMNEYGYYNGKDMKLSDSLPKGKLQTWEEYVASPEFYKKDLFA